MFTEALMEYCAPTLAGLKTGNLFSIRDAFSDIDTETRKLNIILTGKGLHLIPIKRKGKNTLMYLYRPARLRRDLQNPEAIKILEEKGYPCSNPLCCLVKLIHHLKTNDDFPHEIGLFLSYPPADVKAFMNDPCEGVKYCGCWKAYSNECEARKTFEKYKKCTEAYRTAFKNGKPLESLISDEYSDLRFVIQQINL